MNAKLKYGDIPKTVHKRRDAVLALADAQARMAEGRVDDAHDEAIEAARHAPTLVPAAVMASRAYIAMGKPRNAGKLIRDAWNNEPHPDLAGAYAEIEPNETPEERVERFQPLLRARPGHPEARMLEAELEIAAENFPGARKALGNLTETHPNARTMTLMAAIERGEGSDDSTVKAWLAKALTVSRGPQWICDNCSHVHGEWVALCENCHAFDSLSWREAPASEGMQGSAAAMLPLIIGALERPQTAGAPPVDDDVIDQPPSGTAEEDSAAQKQPS